MLLLLIAQIGFLERLTVDKLVDSLFHVRQQEMAGHHDYVDDSLPL
jgi:hypothetical protein